MKRSLAFWLVCRTIIDPTVLFTCGGAIVILYLYITGDLTSHHAVVVLVCFGLGGFMVGMAQGCILARDLYIVKKVEARREKRLSERARPHSSNSENGGPAA